MAHNIYINAINCEANKKLKNILDQWDSFIKVLDGLNDIEQEELLRSILYDNELIQPINKKLPLLMIASEQMTDILLTDQPTVNVYVFILDRVRTLKAASFYLYKLRYDKEPIMTFVWKDDIDKLSKRLLKNMIPIKVDNNLL